MESLPASQLLADMKTLLKLRGLPVSCNWLITAASEQQREDTLFPPFSFQSSFPLIQPGAAQGCSTLRLWWFQQAWTSRGFAWPADLSEAPYLLGAWLEPVYTVSRNSIYMERLWIPELGSSNPPKLKGSTLFLINMPTAQVHTALVTCFYSFLITNLGSY